jgi:hypothetical protein
MARPVVIALGKQILLWDLKSLMSRNAAATKQDIDRVFPADTCLADSNQVVAHGVIAEINYALKLAIATHFTSRNLVWLL